MPGLFCTSHPAPVPLPPMYPNIPARAIPAKLSVRGITSTKFDFVLEISNFDVSKLAKLEVFHYEQTDQEPSASLWRKISDVFKIASIPHFVACNRVNRCRRHHFTVRAMNIHEIYGPFSEPVSY